MGMASSRVNGTGGTVPPNADVTKGYKDVFGLRLGGDYNLIRDKLAIRAGAFFESTGQDAQYQSIDFPGAKRFGLAIGGTYRIRFGGGEVAKNDDGTPRDDVPPPPPGHALDFHLGYGHVFFATQTNDDPYANGLPAITGTTCNPAPPPSTTVSGPNCPDGKPKYRTNWPVNLGRVTSAINAINVGVAYKF